MSRENHRIQVRPLTLPDLGALVTQSMRTEILVSLAHSPKDVSTLASERQVAIDTISHHLQLLRGAHLVVFDKIGTRKTYRLGPRVRCTVRSNVLHLVIDTPDHHELELRFPFDSRIEWNGTSALHQTHRAPGPGHADAAL